MIQVLPPKEPLYYLKIWRFHSLGTPIGVNSIEEGVAEAYWGQSENFFAPDSLVNRSGEVVLDREALCKKISEFKEPR